MSSEEDTAGHGGAEVPELAGAQGAQPRRARELLLESEAKYRALFEAAGDAIFLLRIDGTEMRVVECNDCAQTMFGATREQLHRLPVPHFAPAVQPDGAPSVETAATWVRRALAGGVQAFEWRHRRMDGTPFDTDVVLTRVPLGNAPHLLAIVRDATARRKAEAELERTRLLLEATLEQSPVPTAVVSTPDLVARYANRAALEILGVAQEPGFLGLTLDEVAARQTWQDLRPDGTPIALKDLPLARAARGETTRDEEYTILRKDGTRRWELVSGTPILDRSGALVAGLIVFPDITERKRAEEALRAAEERWQFALEGAGDGVWDWNVQTNEIFFSRQWKAMLGYAEHEIGAALSEWENRVHPDDLPRALADLRRHLSGETATYVNEHRLRCKDGSWKWILDRGKVVSYTPDGRPLRVVGTHTDLTARKLAEQAFLQEQAFTDAVLDSVPGLLYLYDQQGYLVRWNKKHEETTGYSAEELKHMHVLDWYKGHADDTARISAGVQKALEEGFADAEANLITKSGHTIPFYFTAVRLNIAGAVYFTGIGIDITERKRLEEQLRQSQKMEAIGQLAGGVAHDFNNILTAVLGNVELAIGALRADHSEPGNVLAGLQQIERSAERAAVLTRQLLAFSRRQVVRLEVLNLNATLRDLEKMLPRLLTENIVLEQFLAPDLAATKADAGQLEQVVVNLVVNARDAMPNGGRLTLETSNVVLDESYVALHPGAQAGEHVVLTVSDTGHGMERATLERIFEPFFTTKPQGQGTGLGLPTVYGIVKQAGGHVNVYSEPGRGTTFRVYLPAVHEPLSGAKAVRTASAPPRGTETLIICEDDAAVRKLAARILARAGYDVLEAQDTSHALQLAATHTGPLQLLITDVIMPDMNGRQLSEALANVRPGVRTLFVSGYTSDVIAHHGVLDENVDFLEKPYSQEQLLKKVREVLDKAMLPAGVTRSVAGRGSEPAAT